LQTSWEWRPWADATADCMADRPPASESSTTAPEGSDRQELMARVEALRESEQRFRAMADAAPAMLWLTDTNHQCTFLSRGWYEYTGQAEDAGLGFGWLDAAHPDDRKKTAQGFTEAASDRRPFSLDFRLRTDDGEYRWVLDQGRPRFSEDGEWLGYAGSVIDVHDRIVAVQALRKSEAR
jgi:PAS domain S-box-containing protein